MQAAVRLPMWCCQWMAALVMAAAVSSSALAQAADVGSGSGSARGWLQRIHAAASQRNYEGTLVVSTGAAMSSSRLAHYCEGDQHFERIEMLDGQPRLVYRHNEQVLTVWPTVKVAHSELRDAVVLFPAVLSGSEEQLLERYEMLAEGAGRVAGLEAAVFLLRPRDSHRFAQRLWADRASGLLLRADVLAPDGRVLEAAAFTEVRIGVKSQPESVLAPMRNIDGLRMLRSTSQRTGLESEGWRLPPPVPGFRQISCVKRSLDPAAADTDRATPSDVVQTIFSDGLTHISVFIEPLRADHHRPGAGAVGATHTLMQPLGSNWITVMGDVPISTLKKFAAALERLR